MSIDWNDPRIGQPIEPIDSCAWIDPLGKFFAVPNCGHSRWAREYYGVDEYKLEQYGWVHVSGGSIMFEKEPRQSQIDTLYDVLTVYSERGFWALDTFRRSLDRLLNRED